MTARLNLILLALVLLLGAGPLLLIHRPATPAGGQARAIFTGADDQARNVIGTVAPGYRPWAHSLMVPPSSEVESLLFALQAALGAGFIGYYFGSRRRDPVAPAPSAPAPPGCPDPPDAPGIPGGSGSSGSPPC